MNRYGMLNLVKSKIYPLKEDLITPEDVKAVLDEIINSTALSTESQFYANLDRDTFMSLYTDVQLTPGRLYYVQDGAGIGRHVLVRALGMGELAPEGFLVLPISSDYDKETFYPARVDVRTSYAGPRQVDYITRTALLDQLTAEQTADSQLPAGRRLLARGAARPGQQYAIATGTGDQKVFVTFRKSTDTVFEAAQRSDKPGLWRYDLTQNTFARVDAAVSSLATTITFTQTTAYNKLTADFSLELTGAQSGAVAIVPFYGSTAPSLTVVGGLAQVKLMPGSAFQANRELVYWLAYVDHPGGAIVYVTISQI